MDSAEPLPDWTIGCFFDKYATRGRGDRERRILRARASAGVGRGVRRDLQGVSAATKAVELQRRSDHGNSAKANWWLMESSRLHLPIF